MAMWHDRNRKEIVIDSKTKNSNQIDLYQQESFGKLVHLIWRRIYQLCHFSNTLPREKMVVK